MSQESYGRVQERLTLSDFRPESLVRGLDVR